MAVPFLKKVAEHLLQQHKDTLESCCVVLPNKRASLFLKNTWPLFSNKTLWLPKIMGAEEFFTELSELTVLEEIDLVCRLYESYRICYGENAETFDSFSKWALIILQDFNEIDRYLADPKQIYENLRNIKVIENWSLGEDELSEQQQSYLKFMASIGSIYEHFNAQLLAQNTGYQGMVYRKAIEKFENSKLVFSHSKFIFCGFNAMNAAEEKIVHSLFLRGKAELLWDTDAYYMNMPEQEAGLFLRRLVKLMPDARKTEPEKNYSTPKEISVVSVPKQMGQAMVVKQKIEEFLNEGASPDQIAVVLANEKLLWPVLKQLPESIEQVNITMEYPIRLTPAYSLLNSLIQLQLVFSRSKKNNSAVFYQDFIQLIKEPLFFTFLESKSAPIEPEKLLNQIRKRNISFISPSLIKELFGESFIHVQPLFETSQNLVEYTGTLCDLLESISLHLRESPFKNNHQIELEFLQTMLQQFSRFKEIIQFYPHFNQVSTYRQLFHQVIGYSSAPFSGEPLRGLQIMGILESRTLDFEYLILVNVNEGVLPAGKSTHSFLPNDLKRAFGLPLYTEKDAIYAYHFYRLLQRANKVCITYDSETDTFGKGERSRFVTQLELELPLYSKEIFIKEEIAGYNKLPIEGETSISIQKSEAVLSKIIDKSTSDEQYKGLSPSSLIAFKECPLRFYFRYSAGLKESEEVEESAESNTMGSILHLSLETLYKDCCGIPINKNMLISKKELVTSVVRKSFMSFFDNNEPSGKSLLQEEVIKVYVNKQLKQDIHSIESLTIAKRQLKLLYLEHELSAKLLLTGYTEPLEVFIKGKADRIELYGSDLRIIDYKSSIKSTDKFEFESFETLFSDSQYNKQLQLFIYAWLSYKNKLSSPEQIKPCIIAFKQYSEEPKFLTVNKKPFVFSETFFSEFETALSSFVAGIFNRNETFHQTNDEELCKFCAYKTICNRIKI